MIEGSTGGDQSTAPVSGGSPGEAGELLDDDRPEQAHDDLDESIIV